ncbi:MAG: hypothetical protein K8I02_05990 [Candidatus Methylomirabilis sp.]|nr:hypothetical protein [Deltaproteobacteria bacterium]
MNSRSERIERALALFEEGDAAAAGGRWRAAYDFYTAGHDLVVDSPPTHRLAHERLLRANLALGNRGEARTDRVLLALAPFGVFHLIAPFVRPTAAPEAAGE